MAGPFHHDVRGDAEGEGVDDEGASAGELAQFLAVAHIRDEFRQGSIRQVGELDVLLESGQISGTYLAKSKIITIFAPV